MVTHFFYLERFIFKVILLCILSCIGVLYACGPNTSHPINETNPTNTAASSVVKHAIGFDLQSFEDWQLLSFFRHFNASIDTIQYVLYNEGTTIPAKYSGLEKIQIPVKGIGLLHSSYISFLEFCGAMDRIVAVSEAKYVYHDSLHKALEEGLIPEIGYEESINREKLLELGSPLVLNVGFPNSPNKSSQLLKALDIPVLVFSEWQEESPLGRAEWVKIVAALTGTEQLVAEKFSKVEAEYHRLTSLTKEKASSPTVICNLPYKGAWYMPGGDSYFSNILQDAGADYLWSDSQGTGGLQVDFEAVYAKGLTTDFWINPGLSASLRDVIDKDERLADFKPVADGKVFNSTNRVSEWGANDYWESAVVRPDLVLRDLISIIHPDQMPEHKLFYYKQLK